MWNKNYYPSKTVFFSQCRFMIFYTPVVMIIIIIQRLKFSNNNNNIMYRLPDVVLCVTYTNIFILSRKKIIIRTCAQYIFSILLISLDDFCFFYNFWYLKFETTRQLMPRLVYKASLGPFDFELLVCLRPSKLNCWFFFFNLIICIDCYVFITINRVVNSVKKNI